jgi:hypothetical protein
MPRKKQIIKVKKTQKQKHKVSVVVNVNSNNKKKNVISRQPKMTPQSSAPQVIYIQTPQQVSSNVNDRFSVPSASPHINEKVLDKAPPPPTAAVDPITTDPRLRAELVTGSIEVSDPILSELKTRNDYKIILKNEGIDMIGTGKFSQVQLERVYKAYKIDEVGNKINRVKDAELEIKKIKLERK